MTNSSAYLLLLEAAQNGQFSYALLKDIAMQAARSVPDLLDDLSYFVASQYSSGKMAFEESNIAMNALWPVCVSEEFWVDHDRTIPSATTAVYLAFDAGEYSRESDPPDIDPEINYTKPLIKALLSEKNKTE